MLFLLTKGDESTTISLSISSGRIMAKSRPIRPPKLWPEVLRNRVELFCFSLRNLSTKLWHEVLRNSVELFCFGHRNLSTKLWHEVLRNSVELFCFGHRNLSARTRMFALVLQTFWGKKPCKKSAYLHPRQGNLLNWNICTGTLLEKKTLRSPFPN
jgi:hypothetical protein